MCKEASGEDRQTLEAAMDDILLRKSNDVRIEKIRSSVEDKQVLESWEKLMRNRTVGVRLGKGESIEEILASSTQVAEGVATAGVVVHLASRYKVALPVLTAVARIIAGQLSPREAVYGIMNLPQIEER
eukprot:jgi/Pico_ML_1/52830/g3480.t1